MGCRQLLVVVVLVAALAVFATAAVAADPGEASCRTSEVRVHDEAVFGHFSTTTAAKALRKHAAAAGFQGIKIENDGCGDFEVEIDGADTQAQRTSFAAEAQSAGFQVTFEQTAAPLAFKQGQVVGIFAAKTTVAAANALMLHLAGQGFRYIDLARTATRWLVVMPQVPVKHALSIAHEAAVAGFHVQFRPGWKS